MNTRTTQRLFAIFTGFVITFALIAALLLFTRGVGARAPGVWETRVMNFAKRKVLVGDKNFRNPLAASSALLAEGQQNFSHYCYVCHGLDGQNTGVPFADTMSPPVPSLASKEIQAYTDGQLHWIIVNGLWPSGMPAARGILTEEEIWRIVLYLRHLPPAGSLGEPPAYSGAAFPVSKSSFAIAARHAQE